MIIKQLTFKKIVRFFTQKSKEKGMGLPSIPSIPSIPALPVIPVKLDNNHDCQKYHTDYKYTNRETKAEYVWKKYRVLLTGDILDVGADECFLKDYLEPETTYWGIGLGGHPDQQIDLEKEKIPFSTDTYDCVLCLDVLEHLDNIHAVFDELCRVSHSYVIISLPNPWNSFLAAIMDQDYRDGSHMKFYGLPPDPPEDRHKWFFSYDEAKRFIEVRAERNDYQVEQVDIESYGNQLTGVSLRKNLNPLNLTSGPLWAVLKKGKRSKDKG